MNESNSAQGQNNPLRQLPDELLAQHLRKPEGQIGKEMDAAMGVGNRAMNLHTLAVLDPKPDTDVLEIGMAGSHYVEPLLGWAEGISYTGCDYSHDMVELAMQTNAARISQGKAHYIQASLLELPFGKHAFDQAFSVNTFYFWDDYQKALSELYRVLKPEGEFVLAFRPKHNLELMPLTKYGFSLFENEEIEVLCQKAGFEIKEKTQIIEPLQDRWGKVRERECHIWKFEKLRIEN